jgi:hypothetical protein
MDRLKVGDVPFIGTNVEIIRKLFGKSVDQNRHGGYKIKDNGGWTLPSYAPPNYWINKPNSDNS